MLACAHGGWSVHEQRDFICITCPVGCALEAVVDDRELVELRGQTCQRAISFVREELTDPRRVLTTTVRVRGAALPLVPVRATEALPKGLLLPVMADLRAVVLDAPIEQHQLVLQNVCNSGTDIVTTRPLPRLSVPEPASK